MSVFISHTKKTEQEVAALHDLCDWLETKGIQDWMDREQLDAGDNLRDKIVDAINDSEVCIFIATPNSIKSDWCLMEVGAFMGQRKPIVALLRDITAEQVPKPLRFDVSTPQMSRAAEAAKNRLDKAGKARQNPLVSDMTVDDFQDRVHRAAGLSKDLSVQSAAGIMLMARAAAEALSQPTDARATSVVGNHLINLLGLRLVDILPLAEELFPFQRTIADNSEQWRLLGSRFQDDRVEGCMLFDLVDDRCSSIALVGAVSVVEDRWVVPDGALSVGGRVPQGAYTEHANVEEDA